MRVLDKTKEYYLGNLNKEQRGVLYDYLSSVDDAYETIAKTYFEHICNDYISFEEEWFWTSNKQTHITTDALELFEPQFKQGDKVLYTDDLVNWGEGVYLVKHNESYIIKSDEMLLYAIHIKHYEDEIKVGDWVVSELNDCVFKYQFGRLKDDLTKITDEVLIYKLNEL